MKLHFDNKIFFRLFRFTYSDCQLGLLDDVRKYSSCIILFIVTMVMNRPLMCVESIGPIINLIGETMVSIMQFAFLFFEFFIPFLCGFWITFGERPGENQPYHSEIMETFGSFSPLLNCRGTSITEFFVLSSTLFY